jgi:hypothetical protein
MRRGTRASQLPRTRRNQGPAPLKLTAHYTLLLRFCNCRGLVEARGMVPGGGSASPQFLILILFAFGVILLNLWAGAGAR